MCAFVYKWLFHGSDEELLPLDNEYFAVNWPFKLVASIDSSIQTPTSGRVNVFFLFLFIQIFVAYYTAYTWLAATATKSWNRNTFVRSLWSFDFKKFNPLTATGGIDKFFFFLINSYNFEKLRHVFLVILFSMFNAKFNQNTRKINSCSHCDVLEFELLALVCLIRVELCCARSIFVYIWMPFRCDCCCFLSPRERIKKYRPDKFGVGIIITFWVIHLCVCYSRGVWSFCLFVPLRWCSFFFFFSFNSFPQIFVSLHLLTYAHLTKSFNIAGFVWSCVVCYYTRWLCDWSTICNQRFT